MTPFARRSIVAVFTLTLLIAVNSTARPSKSERESQFESWLKQTEPLLDSADNAPAGVPLIIVRVNAARNGQPIKWELSSSNDSIERNDQMVRLLNLMREANVFSKNDSPNANPTENFLISVEDARSSFKASLGPKELEQNIPAQNLLKLFEVYSSTAPSNAMAKNVPSTSDSTSSSASDLAAIHQIHSGLENK